MTQIREFLIALKVLNNEVRRVIVSTQCILMKKNTLQQYCRFSAKSRKKGGEKNLPVNYRLINGILPVLLREQFSGKLPRIYL